MFSTSFCAVPAFRRVEPAITSAPTGDADLTVGERRRARSPRRRRRTPVSAPVARAASSAPTTQGERPLALIPTTASASVTPSARARVRAAVAVVLGLVVRGDERDHRRRRRSARTRRRRAPRAGPTFPPRRRPAGRRGRSGRRRRRSAPATAAAAAATARRDGRVRGVHQLDELERGAEIEVGACRIARFGAELARTRSSRASVCRRSRRWSIPFSEIVPTNCRWRWRQSTLWS